jgi:hypothetical protein
MLLLPLLLLFLSLLLLLQHPCLLRLLLHLGLLHGYMLLDPCLLQCCQLLCCFNYIRRVRRWRWRVVVQITEGCETAAGRVIWVVHGA